MTLDMHSAHITAGTRSPNCPTCGLIVGQTYTTAELSDDAAVLVDRHAEHLGDGGTPLPLTKGVYPVAWEMGELVLYGRLALITEPDGFRHLFRWNGFVGPAFSREEVERYAAWVLAQKNDELNGDPLYTWIEWEGDVAICHDPTYEFSEADPPYRLAPTPEGLYYLGDSWTWQIVEGEL